MTIGAQWMPKLFAECLDLTQQTLLPPSNLRLVQFQTILFWMMSGAEELKSTFCTVPIQKVTIVAPMKELVLFANLQKVQEGEASRDSEDSETGVLFA